MKGKTTKKTDSFASYSYKTADGLTEELTAYHCFEYIRKNTAIKSSGEQIKNVELVTWIVEYTGTNKDIVCNNNHIVYYAVLDDRERLEYDRPCYVFSKISDAISAVDAINKASERKDYFSIVSKTVAIVSQRELHAHGFPYRLPSELLQHFMNRADIRLKVNESELLFKRNHISLPCTEDGMPL